MLNEYWAAVVPVIDAAGGVIEQFAGDGVMAIFNAARRPARPRPTRAARAALAIVEAGRPLADAHPDWPTFRVGVNTGPAVVGNVGAAGRRSFAAIGDTTQHGRAPDVGRRTRPGRRRPGDMASPRSGRAGVSLGPTRVKGKRAPVEAWVLANGHAGPQDTPTDGAGAPRGDRRQG